jgi:ferredoxin
MTLVFHSHRGVFAAEFARTWILTLHQGEGDTKQLAFGDNSSLFSVLDQYGVVPKKGHCLGNRICGKCKVFISKGPMKERTKTEAILLGDAPLETHLACELKLDKSFNGAQIRLDL